MELEKSNETVWSIKRRGIPGKFILRSTELVGEIRRVCISLEENNKTVTFNMKYPEFINFFGILSSFKALIESPNHLLAQQSTSEEFHMEKANISNAEGEEAYLDFSSESSNETVASTSGDIRQTKLDEGLKNLEDLFENFSMDDAPEKAQKKQTPILNTPQVNPPATKNNKIKNLMSEKISNSMKSTQVNAFNQKINKKKLQETDWDPW